MGKDVGKPLPEDRAGDDIKGAKRRYFHAEIGFLDKSDRCAQAEDGGGLTDSLRRLASSWSNVNSTI